jgi:hypothetical protein
VAQTTYTHVSKCKKDKILKLTKTKEMYSKEIIKP